MLSAHKRTNPFGGSDLDDDMDICGSVKKSRWDDRSWEENIPLRKRTFNQLNVPSQEQSFTLKDLERVREETKASVTSKIRNLVQANESLKQALQEALNEKEKLANDCKVLKAGVVSLNNRNQQLGRELEITSAHLREECEKNKQLQSTIIAMHANWSLGACRKDDHGGPGASYDGDVY